MDVIWRDFWAWCEAYQHQYPATGHPLYRLRRQWNSWIDRNKDVSKSIALQKSSQEWCFPRWLADWADKTFGDPGVSELLLTQVSSFPQFLGWAGFADVRRGHWGVHVAHDIVNPPLGDAVPVLWRAVLVVRDGVVSPPRNPKRCVVGTDLDPKFWELPVDAALGLLNGWSLFVNFLRWFWVEDQVAQDSRFFRALFKNRSNEAGPVIFWLGSCALGFVASRRTDWPVAMLAGVLLGLGSLLSLWLLTSFIWNWVCVWSQGKQTLEDFIGHRICIVHDGDLGMPIYGSSYGVPIGSATIWAFVRFLAARQKRFKRRLHPYWDGLKQKIEDALEKTISTGVVENDMTVTKVACLREKWKVARTFETFIVPRQKDAAELPRKNGDARIVMCDDLRSVFGGGNMLFRSVRLHLSLRVVLWTGLVASLFMWRDFCDLAIAPTLPTFWKSPAISDWMSRSDVRVVEGHLKAIGLLKLTNHIREVYLLKLTFVCKRPEIWRVSSQSHGWLYPVEDGHMEALPDSLSCVYLPESGQGLKENALCEIVFTQKRQFLIWRLPPVVRCNFFFPIPPHQSLGDVE